MDLHPRRRPHRQPGDAALRWPWQRRLDHRGGPILTLKGKDIHIFILPTGTRPGAVLQVGDTFHFAGHIMPTLDSRVAVTVTAPGGTQHVGGGQANHVGYFYDPADDFVVDVRVWHDGQCSGGATMPPYPSGDVLGSEDGRYWFYVVPGDSPRLDVSSPSPGFLSFDNEVAPITIAGAGPAGLSGATVDYTISMPGYILDHGQVTPVGGIYTIVFDPAMLHNDFPNLDLVGRDDPSPGLADTFAIGLLLRGQSGSSAVYRANTITLQGEEVFVTALTPTPTPTPTPTSTPTPTPTGTATPTPTSTVTPEERPVFLPLILKGNNA